MSATVAQASTDRSDFRTILIGGTKIGLITAALVIVYLALAKHLPEGGVVRGAALAVVVLAGGTVAAFLPGRWSVARNAEGIAGAAAMGLWGTIVFSIVDIVLLRPFKAYPWTWDDVGGGTTWWYLPMWWILGTFLAWMGGVRIAALAAAGGESVGRIAGPVVLGALALAWVARAAGLHVLLPVAAGAGFAITLLALALISLVRKA